MNHSKAGQVLKLIVLDSEDNLFSHNQEYSFFNKFCLNEIKTSCMTAG